MMAGGKEVMAGEVGLHGESQDERDMERLGKAQQFKVGRVSWTWGRWRIELTQKQRNFRFFTILGLTTTLMCSWESILL
jgi:choline transport protein